ncbi:MAG: DUF2812 domain-containing protein [Spirochaetales bacterium]|nr:DUF2812 domain-containing protein [Spirochaetales bacterium]
MSKVVRKFFFVWGEEKEEAFLEEMASQGQRLVHVGFGKYVFEPDNPRQMVYKFDFRSFDKIDEKEYLQLYEDAGWNFVSKFGGWSYFCREKSDDDIDLSLFNDNASRRQKYKRILIVLALTGFPLYYQILIFFPLLDSSEAPEFGFYYFLKIIVTVLAGLHLFALVRIALKYRALQKEIKE